MFVVFGWQYCKSATCLQLQDIEDTSNDSTFMDDVTSYSYNSNFVHPRGE